jgi:metallo-beta-lactamase class B
MSRPRFFVIAILSSMLVAATLSSAAHAQAPNSTTPAQAASAGVPPDWINPFLAHRVMGNIYYVGSEGLTSYLITTPQGNILINSSLEQSVPLIQASIEKLGFKFSDTKILLISHAHYDHCAGSAKIKAITHAKYMVLDADVPVVESGGKKDFQYGDRPEDLYPAAKVDRILHDGDEVKLGNVVLVAHKTAGHTKGCTTWTMKVTDDKSGKIYDVVIVGSPNINPGYKLVNNAAYPQIAQDYEHAFAVWRALPCDIFLGAHGAYYDMAAKYPKLADGGANPFIDPQGYKTYISDHEVTFQEELKKQQQAATAK